LINFKQVEISDKTWIYPFLKAADSRACHLNFTNIFAWSGLYNYRVAEVNDFLLVKGCFDDIDYYFYPIGTGNVLKVLEAMKQDAVESKHQFQMMGISAENMKTLNELYPGEFIFEEMRDSFDYLYFIEKLISLAGNKMHSKRNHVNRFKREYKDWQFEIITAENLAECLEMNDQWCKENNCKDDDLLMKERCAVLRCFKNYTELGLEGGLLRVNGEVIAYTIGEKLNSDTYDIHIEKAFNRIRGSYQMINREFAAYIHEKYPEIVYINREEDMGYEGLRKAKLSYKPDKMVEKYRAIYVAS